MKKLSNPGLIHVRKGCKLGKKCRELEHWAFPFEVAQLKLDATNEVKQ